MNINRHIYVFVIICLPILKSDESFFVAKSYNSNYKCVTNSSAALSWIIEDTLKQVSTYIPNRKYHYLDCDISEDQKIKNFYLKDPWELGKTIDSLILDRRWEDMDTELITFTGFYHGQLDYKPLIELEDKYFKMGLSIRTEKEAHIFLCDGPYPPEANCYWLMLQAWKGNASAIRKCERGSIPSQNNKYPNGSCEIPLKRMNHSEYFPKYLSKEFWSHFMLVRGQNYLSFTRIENNNERLILDLEDNEIEVTHIIIHTKMVNALWKIHELDFVYTTQETSYIQMGGEIYPQNNELCVSMFVSMCQFCSLKLTLSSPNFKKDQLYSHQSSEWSEIKFLVENVSLQSYKLFVSTVGTGNHRYWAIDKVRQCQKTEYRIISLNQKAKCQLMSSDNNVISPDGTFRDVENSCPEDTIGHFCVPCNWIYYSCKQIKVCYNTYIGDSICTCSAGYKRYRREDYCWDYCNEGYYGHSCLNKCGKCYYNCNAIDGTCSSCTEGFTGSKCDIPPTTIFVRAPQIVNVTYTTAAVQINNFELRNEMSDDIDDAPSTYSFQITEDKDFNKNWAYTGITLNWSKSVPVVVTSLKADTTYYIRAIIGTKKTTYYSPYIPYATITTPCKDIVDNDVDVKPQNTTVDIHIQSSGITCKVTNYVITITSSSGSRKIIGKNHILFDSLLPFKNYTAVFKKNQKAVLFKTFQTTEGIPESVQFLKLTPSPPTTVALEWRQPHRFNGLFLHYIVEYKVIKFSTCNHLLNTSQRPNRLKVDGTSTIVQHLIPFSSYTFSVFAVNTKFDGIPKLQNVVTAPSEDIATEETPTISKIVEDANSVTIELSSLDCTKVRGPLLGYAIATCIDKWCENETRNEESDLLTTKTITILHLHPFTNHKLELIFCRRKNTCSGNIITTQFKTKPAVPNEVKDILIFSKNDTSISLRWKPPYPPTGLLEEYKIEYKDSYTIGWTNTIIVSKHISTCKLWPEFSCVKISPLNQNLEYLVQISAKNQNPKDFGKVSRTDWLKPGTGQSQAPYDLRFIWSAENDLELQWKHPNQSNGEIQYFQIEISDSSKTTITKTLNVSEETFNLTYHYKIDGKDLKPSNWYKATIYAFNGVNGYPATTTDTSPPKIPTLSTKPQFTTTNQSITITIPSQEHHDTSAKAFFLIQTREPDINELLKTFHLENFKIVDNCTIGSNQKCQKEIEYLDQGTSYNISIILENTFMNKTRYKFYSYTVTTMGESLEMDNSSLFALFLLLLIIPLATILFRKRHQLGEIKSHFLENYFSTNEMTEDQENPVRLSTLSSHNKVQNESEIEPLYANKDAWSKPVKINEFQDYVKASVENGELERQHAMFPRGQTKPWTYGSLNENKAKNRYNNLIAYDHTRVILRKIKGEPNSDYINANYIDGHRIPKAYIATQGPKSSTLFDFWRMIWQENVAHIAMLANIYESGKKKVEKYWPEINETLKFGNIRIAHVSAKVYADFEHRIFNVTRNGETRKVDQLHFLSWPDHGVPLYSQSLVPFLQKLLQIPINPKSPIVVHCSAGVGRTGTILLCDICLRMAAKEGYLDILNNLRKIREQRANLVDNVEQYKLVHLVILECLLGKNTSIPCNEIEESVRKLFTNREISLQMKLLEETQWQDQAMKTTVQSNKNIIDHKKNRFPDIVPESQGQVFINPYKNETSSYINAVLVDGFRSPNRFIVTQQPMPNTLQDFWRLIDEKDVGVVISLNEINTKDKTSCHFWPTKSHPEMTPAPHLTLKHSKTLSLECYNLVTLQLNSKAVEIFSFKNWTSGINCPKSLEQFLTFWEDSDAASRRSKTVVVTCYDGVKASGLYVAMSFVIEKMKLEHCCDVCQAVRNIRHNRSQFVQEEVQFEFLYQAAVKYINGFQSYANFN